MSDNDLKIEPHEVEAISSSADYLDSRDIQERIDWLETQEDKEELEQLLNLKKQYIDDYSENSWSFGAQFINDSYFEDYARELASDIGAIDDKQNWPLQYIDWGAASEALQMDYTEVDFDGVTFYTQEA